MPARQSSFSVVEATIADMQAAMREGRITSRGIVQQYLDRIAKYEVGSTPSSRSTRARSRGRRARSRARAGQGTRAAAWHSDRAQGQHPHDRHADDRRRARVQGVRAAVRGDDHDEPSRCGRDHHREDEHDRAGQLDGHRHAWQLQRARRLWIQSLRSARRSARGHEIDGRPALNAGGSSSARARRRISGRRTWAPRRRARS